MPGVATRPLLWIQLAGRRKEFDHVQRCHKSPSSTLEDNPSVPAKKKRRFFASAWGSFFLALASVFSAAFISVCSTPILDQLKAYTRSSILEEPHNAIWDEWTVVFLHERNINHLTEGRVLRKYASAILLAQPLGITNYCFDDFLYKDSWCEQPYQGDPGNADKDPDDFDGDLSF